ncbi:MAG: nucleotidyltransferase domain-containing protein [Deltaproteobacteria bacterium]|nr:nucleotidyltransferase domain-containing protein [Deltaproteobacteria bacterium]
MPVRSLSSSVAKWPDARTVQEKLRTWVKGVLPNRADLLRVGYFGSYARGDWGVGSDLDLLIIVRTSSQPFERRAAEWNTMDLPVPADVLVYTEEEWQALMRRVGRFSEMLRREVIWIHAEKEEAGGSDR